MCRRCRAALGRRLALGMVAGALVTALLVAGVLGIRPDLHAAMHGFSFWMKWTYTASLGIGSVMAVLRLARPNPQSLRGLWWLSVPVLLLAGIGIGELAYTPRATGWRCGWGRAGRSARGWC
jgi:hypothetical protein